MKKCLPFLLMVTSAIWVKAQVITPNVVGKFGVDGEVQMNLFGTSTSNTPCTSCDDWYYKFVTSAGGGSSYFVIDTTGAAAIVAAYSAGNNLNVPFYRKMRYNAYYQLEERTFIDAIFVRDYHGNNDQTIFASGSNKNGDSPGAWVGSEGGVPDKTEILDAYVHLRRDGPTFTASDELWMYGGLALENTNGNRYFDFEMYQTDIFYTRSTHKFTGYGPDAGHTSWKFDAAGNVTQPGDIVFSAFYDNSSLSVIEARIWVDTATFNHVIPATFDFVGGGSGAIAGATNNPAYGYVAIQPKDGSDFYYGTENSAATWAGPFKLVRTDNSVVTNFQPNQFMEFGVNLTILGLDPVTLLGKTTCGIPFSKVLIKTRSSESFTSELKDFIGPFDFFMPDSVQAAADVPVFCGSTGVANIAVTNAYPTSSYTWTTTDGNIVGATSGSPITVDQPGTYIVTQILETGCPNYAVDTVQITYSATCSVLADNQLTFKGLLNNRTVDLDWTVTRNQEIKSFTLERSTDGQHFTLAGTVGMHTPETQYGVYSTTDDVSRLTSSYVYYRLKITGVDGQVLYSKIVKVSLMASGISEVTMLPNPVRDVLKINFAANASKDVQVLIYDIAGQLMKTMNTHVQRGFSTITLNGFESWAKGVYTVKIVSGKETFVDKMLLTK